ncbi:MAG: hypothetical protein R3D26_19395 [Cyanobacteriota/Melainabacteria group bacterium]
MPSPKPSPPTITTKAISLELLSQIYFNNEKYYLGAPVLTRLMQLYKEGWESIHRYRRDYSEPCHPLPLLGRDGRGETYYQSAIEIREVVQGKNSPEAAQLRHLRKTPAEHG